MLTRSIDVLPQRKPMKKVASGGVAGQAGERPAGGAGPVIVVLQGQAAVRRALRAVLAGGAQIVPCASPNELQRALELEPAVVVLDPRSAEEAYALCEQVRREAPEVPIVFADPGADRADPAALLEAHWHPELPPARPAERTLLEAVEMAVRRSRMARECKKMWAEGKRERDSEA